MPIILSPASIIEKNKIESLGAWIVLIRLTSPDEVTDLFLCHNTEDVTVNTQLYQAFPFEITDIIETSSGSLPSFSLKVSNIDRIIQGYVEADTTFGSGWDIDVGVISSEHLSDAPEMEFDAVSLNVTCDKTHATFSCGVGNPLMQQFPRQRYSSGYCQRQFKDGIGCTYSNQNGTNDTSCDKTLTACQAKFPIVDSLFRRTDSDRNNIGLPYLAFSGIPSRAIY